MSKYKKIWIITASVLVVIGIVVFSLAMQINRWDFSALNTYETEINTYDISEEISNINIDTDTADIYFVKSQDNVCKVVCNEYKKIKHTVTVNEGTLTVKSVDTRKWQDYIAVVAKSPKITVFLPKEEYALLTVKESTGDIKVPRNFKFLSADISLSTGDVEFSASAEKTVKIELSTGDIEVENTLCDMLDLTVSTGEIEISDTVCTNLISSGSTGDISLENVNVKEKISIKRSTGEVEFEDSDAGEIFVKTTTGDVTGTLLTDKIFIAESSSGDINVPRTAVGGKCQITTSTGDIKIRIGR